jgi:hypothetical protein
VARSSLLGIAPDLKSGARLLDVILRNDWLLGFIIIAVGTVLIALLAMFR